MGTAALLLFLSLMVTGVVVLLLLLLWGNRVFSGEQRGKSPYGNFSSLRKVEDLQFEQFSLAELYLQKLGPKQRKWNLEKALVCEQTGRIFPSIAKKWIRFSVSKTFLSNLYPGKWVIWENLGERQKEHVMKTHQSLKGYNLSYQNPFAKPGPLYVDLNSGSLLGWKCVQETDLEVIVFQAPNDLET